MAPRYVIGLFLYEDLWKMMFWLVLKLEISFRIIISPHDLTLLCGFVCIMLLHGFVLAILVSSICSSKLRWWIHVGGLFNLSWNFLALHQPTKQELLKTLSVSPQDDFLCQLLQFYLSTGNGMKWRSKFPKLKSSPKCNVNYWEAPLLAKNCNHSSR